MMIYIESIWNWISENWEGIIASCAFFVSFLAWKTSKKHNQLSIRPYFSSHEYNYNEGDYYKIRFTVSNKGLGPAIIKKVVYTYKNESITNLENHLKELLDNHYFKIEYIHNFLKEPIISKGENIDILLLSFPTSKDFNKGNLNSLFDDYQLSIEFTDIYNSETFKYTTKE